MRRVQGTGPSFKLDRVSVISAMAAFGLALSATVWAAEKPTLGRDTPLPVDMELVLAVDVSGSIDLAEAQLQRQGYLSALSDPSLVAAIQRGGFGRIAATYIEWSGQGQQRMLVDWRLIQDTANALAFVAALRTRPVVVEEERRTSISGAIDFSVKLFEGNGFEGTRRVIDISGDGRNNVGFRVTERRDKAVAAGITINGLPIVNARHNPSGAAPPADLELYYRDCVIGGAGSFIVIADGYDTFGPAIRRKLVLEVAGGFVSSTASAHELGRPNFLLAAARTGSGCSHTL